jgi:hypothetical protein
MRCGSRLNLLANDFDTGVPAAPEFWPGLFVINLTFVMPSRPQGISHHAIFAKIAALQSEALICLRRVNSMRLLHMIGCGFHCETGITAFLVEIKNDPCALLLDRAQLRDVQLTAAIAALAVQRIAETAQEWMRISTRFVLVYFYEIRKIEFCSGRRSSHQCYKS